jgi:Arc/MetJ-type ribon-helix-helix transcriptional regulator
MTVELPPAPSRTLSQLLKSGAYSSPAEAVAEGLHLLQQLVAGVNQVRAGKVAPFDESAAARIKARGRKLLAAEQRAKRSSGR